MRNRFFLLGILVIALVGCSKGGQPPGRQNAGFVLIEEEDEGPLPAHLEQPAVPQIQESIERRRAERLAAYRSSTVDAYSRVGRKNPKWDDAAIDALTKLAITKANSDRDLDALEAAWEAVEKCVALGCDDPLIRYAQARFPTQFQTPEAPEVYRQRVEQVCLALRDSKYPTVRRAHAAHNYATAFAFKPGNEDALVQARATARELLRQALKENPREVSEDFVGLADLAIDCDAEVKSDPSVQFKELSKVLGDDPEFHALRSWLKGKYLLAKGWDIRGHEYAHKVPDEDMRRFHDHLRDAADAFKDAWEADPTCAEAAVGIMLVCGPVGDFDGLEHWFQRAMEADGDCVSACRVKHNYLQPKWGGHSAAMRQFAVRLGETKNWHAGLPFYGVEIYRQKAIHSSEEDGVSPRDWPATQRVFEDFLKDRPDSRWGWTAYFKLAAESNQGEIAIRAGEKVKGRCSRAVMNESQYIGLMGLTKSKLGRQ